MRRVAEFFDVDSLELIRMDNTGQYRLKINHPGAIDTIPISEEKADDLRDLVEMDQQERSGDLTEKGEAYNPEVLE